MSAVANHSTGFPQAVKTISVTSGKGGVGKSTLVANMAIEFAKQGQRVLLLDGDLGMANLDIMFGVKPKYDIHDVVTGKRFLEEVAVPVHPRISLIPGGSGIYELASLNLLQKRILLDQVNDLDETYDVMLVDTAPGIDENVLYLNSASQEIVVVLTPDPASMADSYALIKVLNQKKRENRFSIVCNMVRDEREALALFKRISDVADRFLYVSLDYKGFVPMDQELRNATKSQQLIVNSSPRCPSSFAIKGLSKKLSRYEHIGNLKGGVQFFWQQLVGVA